MIIAVRERKKGCNHSIKSSLQIQPGLFTVFAMLFKEAFSIGSNYFIVFSALY